MKLLTINLGQGLSLEIDRAGEPLIAISLYHRTRKGLKTVVSAYRYPHHGVRVYELSCDSEPSTRGAICVADGVYFWIPAQYVPDVATLLGVAAIAPSPAVPESAASAPFAAAGSGAVFSSKEH